MNKLNQQKMSKMNFSLFINNFIFRVSSNYL